MTKPELVQIAQKQYKELASPPSTTESTKLFSFRMGMAIRMIRVFVWTYMPQFGPH